MGRYVHITLAEYFKIKGYGRGKKINQGVFADFCGVGDRFISLLINNHEVSHGKEFKAVDAYLQRDGYRLIRGDALAKNHTHLQRKADLLEKENADLKMQVSFLEGELQDLKEFKRLAIKIASKSEPQKKKK